MKKLLFFFWIFMSCNFAWSQAKHEFRAVWVATVANIDWPSKPGLSSREQKKEIIKILDLHKSLGMNAIILQVRPSADALYFSELEPWSGYLTGEQGKAPRPFYDPLHFWIKECHERGMELHAWLNPYRVATSYKQELSENHIARKNPNWILKYGEALYFDPGIPETRDFVVKVVKDIVSRYDVDAIHFDDYFYPYPLAEEFPDTSSFENYNRGYQIADKADWRRENVDIIIHTLNDTIKATKSWVKFGISPFGVWRNIDKDPLGSNTRAGASNYDHLYADVLKWQKNGWIDYLLPQLYWQIGHPLVDFELLSNWWKKHSYGRAMYIGQAPYKIDTLSTVKEWTEPSELPKQIRLLRTIPEIGGSAYFSSKHFNRDLFGFQDSLKLVLYKNPAIVPVMEWLDSIPPQAPRKVRKLGKCIRWKREKTDNEWDKPKQYVIYAIEEGKEFNPTNPNTIFTIIRENKYRFSKINKKRKPYEVRVSVLDRLNNESKVSTPVTLKL